MGKHTHVIHGEDFLRRGATCFTIDNNCKKTQNTCPRFQAVTYSTKKLKKEEKGNKVTAMMGPGMDGTCE